MDVASIRVPVTAVVGTWGWRGLLKPQATIGNPNANVWKYLNDHRLTMRCDRKGRGFSWTSAIAGAEVWRRLFGSEPSILDWEVGAVNLLDFHLPMTVQSEHHLPGCRTHVIAHSHGGNLPYIAAAMGLRINCLATISTPIRMDVLNRFGPEARANIGYHVHYYSDDDFTQMLGGAGDGHIGLIRKHPYADVNVRLPENAGHSGLLENPFYFGELLTFVDEVLRRDGNEAYLQRGLWTPDYPSAGFVDNKTNTA